MKTARISRRSAEGGLARFILGVALLVPLGVVLLLLGQLPATGLASPSVSNSADAASGIVSRRPAASNLAPPPTLEPPATTPKPTGTPIPAVSVGLSVALRPGDTYTVRPGDELKSIAAHYDLSIHKIIAANDIPDPDSLRIGQVLRIPLE